MCSLHRAKPCARLCSALLTHPSLLPAAPQHCDPANQAAWGLYKELGYRRAALEAPWAPYLNGRPPNRCALLIKRLPAASAPMAGVGSEAGGDAGGDMSGGEAVVV